MTRVENRFFCDFIQKENSNWHEESGEKKYSTTVKGVGNGMLIRERKKIIN